MIRGRIKEDNEVSVSQIFPYLISEYIDLPTFAKGV